MNTKDMIGYDAVTPRSLRSVLIVTYGRSGSTLLQGLLNDFSGYRISGENNNYLFWIYQSFRQIKILHEDAFAMAASAPSDAYFGANNLSHEKFLRYASSLAYDFAVPESVKNKIRCYGFKEIRYIDYVDELAEYLNFLRMIFPECRFIFNTRNKDDVVRSGWWPEQESAAVIERLGLLESEFFAYIESNREICFHIKYEDVITKSVNLRRLYDFLNEEYSDYDVDKILRIPHSTRG